MQIELPVGRSIVDVAVFNGISTAYEIKTEFDSPKRFHTQSTDYLRAFDRVYVITHPQLADKYASIADTRVGIATMTERSSIKIVREASRNVLDLDSSTIFRMLRQREYVAAVESVFGPLVDCNGLKPI
jgi:hypothetical protein